jgi:cardiolipin synthase A/B
MNQYTLFTDVQAYYENLILELNTAQKNISIVFLSFVQGLWAKKISEVLIAKAQAGVFVRLIVDEIGEVWDDRQNFLQNIHLINHLRSYGIEVEIYRPTKPLKINNRLHCKFVAIDERTVYIGGSNIADFYTNWVDANLRVDGEFGNTFHQLYKFLHAFSKNGNVLARSLDVSNLFANNDRLWLTVPHHHYDVRNAFLNLILDADKFIYIRTWSFLPNEEILNALCKQAKNGVQVNILFSHRTRFRPLDYANYLHTHKLVCAGGNVYRYTNQYMHTKVAWNNHNDILFGSANLESQSLRNNFETCLQFNASHLTLKLIQVFNSDLSSSTRQTSQSYMRRSLVRKALTHACNIATLWL